MPASKSAPASASVRASSGRHDTAQRNEHSTLNVHYVPARMPAGVVTGLWGSAVKRMDDGSGTPLQMGDVIHKGDVLLTTQRGIVQLTAEGKQFITTGDPGLDRLVMRLDDGELDFVTGAGAEGGEGSLQAGVVAERVIEVVSPQEYQYAYEQLHQTGEHFNGGSTGLPDGPMAVDTDIVVRLDGPTGVVEGQTAANYTVTLSHAATVDVTVTLAYAGAATAGEDFTAIPSVTIPAGQTSARFDIATIDDALAEGAEPYTVTIARAAAGEAGAASEAMTIGIDLIHATVTTTITDDAGPFGPGTPGAEDTCLVSISGPGSVVEGEVASGYTVSLSQPAVTDVVVKLTYTGTATDGADYTAVTSVTIPAGQSSATFDIATIDDALAEGTETLTVSLGEITGGGFEAIAGNPAQATVTTTITDDTGPFGPGTPGAKDTCLVSISGPGSVVEGEVASGYTVSLSQPAVTDVVVKLTYTGTATDGSDYTAVTSVTIPAGQSSATFDIATIDDALAEGTETLTVSLGEITGGGFEQITGNPTGASITTTITDDTGPFGPGTPGAEDTCLVSISGPGSVVEGEVASGYTVSLSQPAVTDVVVKLTYTGTATDGSDYTAVTSVTIPAGQSSVTFDIATIDDALAEGTETITVSLGEITGGGFEQIAGNQAGASITTSLVDDSGPRGPEDTCLVSISGPGSVIEGEVASGYTVSLSQPAATDVVVKLTYTGTATDDSDYTAVTSVTIPAGQSSVTFDIATIDDALAEGTETITVSLGEITGGGFEQIAGNPTGASITTTITDDTGPRGPEDTCLVSISGPGSVVEGEIASGYTVSLSQPAVTDVVVKLTYTGTATDGSDYTAVTSVTIPAGQSSATFDIATIDDALAEGTETLTVSLGEITGGGFEQIAGNPTGASITTTITDDTGPRGPEDTCLVSISGPGSVVEGEVASGYTVSLSQPAVTDVVVKLTYTGTATDGSDYTAVTSVTIPAGQSSATFDITTIDDALAEGTETLTVSLGEITGGGFEQIAGNPTGASITTTITDDTGPRGPEDTCLVSISGPGSVVEGEIASGYTVSLSQPAVTDVVVKLTYTGTATDGSDYTAVTSVTIPAGQSSATFDIATIDDALAEGTETLTVSLGEITGGGFEQIAGNPTGASITTTITDDTGPRGPEDTCLVSISGPGSVVEGEVASGYTVSLSQPAVTDVVVKLTYTGTATDGSDYTAVTSVTIPAGQSSATFDITTIDDALAEGTETLTVSLGEITGGGFEVIAGNPAQATVTTTITDDAGPFGPGTPGAEDTCLVSISGPGSVVEGEVASGYTVSLSQPAVTDVVVKLTYTGTATDGSDYTSVTSVTIPAGQSSATFDIPILDDALAEGPETLTVSLGEITGGGFEQIAGNPTGASITTTITDDTGPRGPEDTCLVSISGPGSVVEGEVASGYTVSLSQPAVTDVVVKLTYTGTATDGSDYTAVKEVTITAGQSSATFDIPILDDALAEGPETLTVSLGEITDGGFEQIAGNPAGASITTTITDDTGPRGPEDTCLVSISGPGSVVEGEVASGYTVSLSQPAVTDVVVKLTYTGTATDGSDYTAVKEVTITAGQSSATFDIPILDDALAEGPETLTVSLGEITGGGFEQIAGNPTGASITTTITDDTGPRGPEDTCLVSISGPGSVVEGEVASGYTVSLSQPAVTDVVVKLTYTGTATDGSDYTAVTSVTIPAGQSSATFDITTIDDALAEGTETLTVSLGEITGGSFEAIAGNPAQATVTTTITDDTGPFGPGTPGAEDTCLVSISGPGSVVEGEVASGYTVSLSQPAVTDVVVKLTYTGTATDGSDYTAVTSVTIPAGQSSATFDIATVDDAVAEGTETLTVSLGEITGGGFEQIAGNPTGASITTTITDDTGPRGPEDTCLVSISGPGSVVEGEVASGYTVSLSQPAVTDVVVKLTYTGTATDGSDYTAVTSVTIPAGQSSVTFDIATIDDALAEGTETITVSLGEITGGGFEQIAGNQAGASITTSLVDDSGPRGPEDTCLVSISGPGSVIEGEVASGYTVSLSQPAATDVVVKLTYTGTATDDSDYTAVTSVTIPAGQSSVTFDIATIDDALAEGTETITVSLGEITGGGFEQIAGNPTGASITTTITDDTGPRGPEDTCLVSISGPGSVVEGEIASGYTVSLSQPAVTDVVVKLTYTGTATDGSDYTAVTSVTIPAGQSSATFDIATIDDALAEGTETLTVSLGEITGGGFEAIAGNPAQATVTTTITDDTGPFGPEDTCLVSISGPGSVVEGEVASGYTVSLSHASTSDVVVQLSYSGTAEAGADYTKVASITIPPGVTSYSFGISTQDDALAEGTEQFSVQLGTVSGGSFEAIALDPAHASVTTCIVDDVGPLAPDTPPGTPDASDTVLVSITGPDTVVEGETSSGYVVSLSQPAVTDVVVRLVYTGTATDGADYVQTSSVTIPAGQSSTTFHLATVDDALAEGTETITVALGQISGGGFEVIAGNPAQASVTTALVDDSGPQAPGGGQPPDAHDTVLVSLTGPDTVLEGETASGYTVTLSQAARTDVQVTLSYSGTASGGADYTQVLSVTVPAGQTSASFDLATLDDALAEGTESIVVALGGISGGGFEAVLANPLATSVTTCLVDDVGPGGATPGAEDTAQVSLTGPGQVLEGEVATGYTVTLSQPAATDVVIKLNYAGTATDGADYTRVTTVTIPAGQTSARFDIATLPDAAAEGAENFTVALGAISGGGFEAIRGNPSAYAVTTTITDTAHAPTPQDDAGTVREDQPLSGNVLANDSDPDGDPLSVAGYTWGDVHHPAGSTATLPGIGTLVVEADGRYTFTPARDYAGPVPEVSCVISDGALTTVSNLTLAIEGVNDAPTLLGTRVALSEAGLPGGLPDAGTGPHATQASGTLQFSDVDSPTLHFTLEAPTGLYASGGQALVWSGDGSADHPLVGTAGGQVVLSATIDAQGRYTVELHGPLDHPVRNAEDTLTLSLGVQVSDGQSTSSATLDVTVRDDSPTPFCTARSADLSLVQNNLLITLDVSGSMGTRDGVNGETRLQSAIKSITKLIDSYDNQGEVAVRLVTFSTTGAERGDHWMSTAEAKSALASLCAGGNTNYDAALDAARGAFTDSGHLDGGHNVAYFFSDGRPNLPTGDVGIDAGEAQVWQNFLNQHEIQSYAVGLGKDVPVSALEPVSWNCVTGADDLSPLLVTSFTQLDTVLAHTVAPAISGDVVDGGLHSVTGADGGHLSDIVVNGVHHPWDPATSASDTVSFKTATGGEFTFDMETGHYTYQAPAGARADYQEVLSFTVTDRDGDTRSGQMTLSINADGSSHYDSHCAPPTPMPTEPAPSTCLSGGVLSWTLADHHTDTSACTTGSSTTTSGSGDGGLHLSDVLGSGSHDTLSSWSGPTCSPSPSSGSTLTAGGGDCLSGGSTVDAQLAQTLIQQPIDALHGC